MTPTWNTLISQDRRSRWSAGQITAKNTFTFGGLTSGASLQLAVTHTPLLRLTHMTAGCHECWLPTHTHTHTGVSCTHSSNKITICHLQEHSVENPAVLGAVTHNCKRHRFETRELWENKICVSQNYGRNKWKIAALNRSVCGEQYLG